MYEDRKGGAGGEEERRGKNDKRIKGEEEKQGGQKRLGGRKRGNKFGRLKEMDE